MTSFKQIEANRHNASIRVRQTALRHGLTAETVLDGLEDAEDYKAFELSVTSDFDAQTAVERELARGSVDDEPVRLVTQTLIMLDVLR